MNTEIKKVNASKRFRMILFLLALISSPILCCSGPQLLALLNVDTGLNFFEADANVENGTSETFYLTAITTTYGKPEVIHQASSIQQRDLPLAPGDTVTLKYDSADAPLAGIIVCRAEQDCRVLPRQGLGEYRIDSFESLPPLEEGWLDAKQSYPRNDYTALVFIALGLLPVFLLGGWLYLSRRSRTQLAG